jgi:hypothetical protein
MCGEWARAERNRKTFVADLQVGGQFLGGVLQQASWLENSRPEQVRGQLNSLTKLPDTAI